MASDKSSGRHPTLALSRRRFLQIGAGGALLLSCPAWAKGEQVAGEWWFVHISDSHNGNPDHAETLGLILNDSLAAFPKARFLLNTGDITEHGWEEELDDNLKVMKAFSHPYYNLMGNHDARWSRAGRRAFRERFKATRWAIEHEFLSLFALDCSLLVEQNGHLDPFELSWLEGQLRRSQGKPAVLAFHHPPCDKSRFLDSDAELFRLIAGHNIVAILAGHIHQRKEYEVNGTWIITAGAAMTPKSGYCAFRVRPNEVTLFERRPLDGGTREILTIPYSQSERKVSNLTEVSLESELSGQQIQIVLPVDFEAEKTTLLVSGHEQEFQSQQVAGKTRLALPRTNLVPGHHEIELCAPGVEDKHQRRAWGKVSIPAPAAIGLCWERSMPAGVQSRPAFWKDRLIVGTNNGRLFALKVKSGKEIWQFDTGPDEIISSPVVKGDNIYLGTIGAEVLCLSAERGKLLWKRAVEGSIIASGTFAGKSARFIIGTGKGNLYALDSNTGEIAWKYPVGNLIKATPACDGKRLYFGAWDGHFYAVDAETGAEVWKRRINSPHLSPATCNPGVLGEAVIFSSHDYATHCLDANTGEHRWRFPALGTEFKLTDDSLARCKPSYSSPVFYKGGAYLGSITGHVVGFDVATGKQTFELPVDDPIFDSFPVLVGDVLYFGTTGGTLCAVDLKAGKMAWQYSLGSNFIFSPPGSDGKHLAIGSLGGQLACLEV